VGIRVHSASLNKFKEKLKEVTGRSNAMSMEQRAEKLRQYIVGWVYFGMPDMKTAAQTVNEWLRRRM